MARLGKPTCDKKWVKILFCLENLSFARINLKIRVCSKMVKRLQVEFPDIATIKSDPSVRILRCLTYYSTLIKKHRKNCLDSVIVSINFFLIQSFIFSLCQYLVPALFIACYSKLAVPCGLSLAESSIIWIIIQTETFLGYSRL